MVGRQAKQSGHTRVECRNTELFPHKQPNSHWGLLEHALHLAQLGAGELLVTSMDRDGTREVYDLALTRAIADAVGVPVIASGGVGGLDDLVAGVAEGGASAVLAASIFHFGQASIGEAKAHMAAAGLAMRLDRPAEPRP